MKGNHKHKEETALKDAAEGRFEKSMRRQA
jgi:hypothetical protein